MNMYILILLTDVTEEVVQEHLWLGTCWSIGCPSQCSLSGGALLQHHNRGMQKVRHLYKPVRVWMCGCVWDFVYLLHTLQALALSPFLLSNCFLFVFSIVFICHSLRLNLHAVCIFLVAFTMRTSLHKCVYKVKAAPADDIHIPNQL